MTIASRFLLGLTLVCLALPVRAEAGWIGKSCRVVLAAGAIGAAGLGWWWFQPAPKQPDMALTAKGVSVEGVSPEATLQRTNLFGDMLKEGPVVLEVKAADGSKPLIRLLHETPRQQFIAGIAKGELKKKKPELAGQAWMNQPGLAVPIDGVGFKTADNSDYVHITLDVPLAQLVSKDAFKKSDLMEGKVTEVEFTDIDTPVDGGRYVRIRAKMALQFVPQERAYRILEGRVRFSITETDENKVIETSTAIIEDLRSAPLFQLPPRVAEERPGRN